MNPFEYYEYKSNRKLSEFGIIDPLLRENRCIESEDENMKKYKVKKVTDIKDGVHTGKIMAVLERSNAGYDYVDCMIRMEDEFGTELKIGYPANVSKASGFGKLLMRFGAKLEDDSEVDPEKFLKGKECQFMTVKQKNDKGEFANIIPDTLKPKE